jgi:hypothetical protein
MDIPVRPLNKIAADILVAWRDKYPNRQYPSFVIFSMPYVQAMLDLKDANDMYGCDSADDILIRFLHNAQGWRGEKARAIKFELNQHLENVK